MGMAGKSITNVIARIQYDRITRILNGMNKTNANKESS